MNEIRFLNFVAKFRYSYFQDIFINQLESTLTETTETFCFPVVRNRKVSVFATLNISSILQKTFPLTLASDRWYRTTFLEAWILGFYGVPPNGCTKICLSLTQHSIKRNWFFDLFCILFCRISKSVWAI